MALRWSVGGGSARAAATGPQFGRVLAKFAQELVAQGCIDIAWRLLDTVDETGLDNVIPLLSKMNIAFIHIEMRPIAWLYVSRHHAATFLGWTIIVSLTL